MTSPLDDLIARVEGASGGSRELDGLVEVTMRWHEAARLGLDPEHRARWRSNASGEVSDGHTFYTSAPVSSSVDAVLALVERVGWRVYTIDMSVEGRASCFLKGPPRMWPADGESPAIVAPGWETGTAATPALALLAALLRSVDGERQT